MGAFDHLEWTYDGAFEQLFGLGRGQFEQKFSKNSNARGAARGGGCWSFDLTGTLVTKLVREAREEKDFRKGSENLEAT